MLFFVCFSPRGFPLKIWPTSALLLRLFQLRTVQLRNPLPHKAILNFSTKVEAKRLYKRGDYSIENLHWRVAI